MNELKLYVFTDFCTDYFPGLAVAVAKTEEEAIELIEKALGHRPWDWGNIEVLELDETTRRAWAVTGGT